MELDAPCSGLLERAASLVITFDGVGVDGRNTAAGVNFFALSRCGRGICPAVTRADSCGGLGLGVSFRFSNTRLAGGATSSERLTRRWSVGC